MDKKSSVNNRKCTYIDKTAIATNGENMQIIAYRKWDDIDIQFEDGTIRIGMSYSNFNKGRIRNPNHPFQRVNHIGEKRISHNGDIMMIVGYRKSNDLDVKFLSDGTIVRHKTYSNFKKGKIGNPNSEKFRKRFCKTY